MKVVFEEYLNILNKISSLPKDEKQNVEHILMQYLRLHSLKRLPSFVGICLGCLFLLFQVLQMDFFSINYLFANLLLTLTIGFTLYVGLSVFFKDSVCKLQNAIRLNWFEEKHKQYRKSLIYVGHTIPNFREKISRLTGYYIAV